MSEMVNLSAKERTETGTGPSRALRRTGMIPSTVYGSDKKPLSIILAEKDVTRLYRKHGFTSTVIELDLNGQKLKVLPKAVELNPINELVRHVDFVHVSEGVQKVDVPVVFEGKERSIGLKRGGFLNIIFRKIKLFCPSSNIPLNITIDISAMGIGASIRGSGLKLPEGCSLVAKNDFIVASITGRGGKDDPAAAEAAAAAAPAAKGKAA